MTVPLSLRVAEAEARIYRRTWRGSIVSSFVTPILYLLAMGVGLGSLVDESRGYGLGNVSYLTFLAPGLRVATAMQTGAAEGAWKVMGGIKWRETWKARLASPIGVPSLVFGHMIWSAARVQMVSVAFAIVMEAFQIAPLLQSFLAVVPAFLVGVAMVATTTSFTVRLTSIAGLPMYFRFVVIPMFLFSGVFLPVSNLPDWLQPIALATPMYHGVELAGAIVVGVPLAVAPVVSVAYLLAWIIAGTYFAMTPIRRKLKP
jgi:lipooligosaccharide transport system permease protein